MTQKEAIARCRPVLRKHYENWANPEKLTWEEYLIAALLQEEAKAVVAIRNIEWSKASNAVLPPWAEAGTNKLEVQE